MALETAFGWFTNTFNLFRSDKAQYRRIRRDTRFFIRMYPKMLKEANLPDTDCDLSAIENYLAENENKDEISKDISAGNIDTVVKAFGKLHKELHAIALKARDKHKREDLVELHKIKELTGFRDRVQQLLDAEVDAARKAEYATLLAQIQTESKVIGDQIQKVLSEADIIIKKGDRTLQGMLGFSMDEASVLQEMKKIASMERRNLGGEQRDYKKINRFLEQKAISAADFKKELDDFKDYFLRLDTTQKRQMSEFIDDFRFTIYLIRYVLNVEMILKEMRTTGFPAAVADTLFKEFDEDRTWINENLKIIRDQGRWLETRIARAN